MPDKGAIRLAHGFGGKLTQDLLDSVILPAVSGAGGHAATLDAAVLDDLHGDLVVSTDSYTVSPRFFPGGDIGTLAVSGTVNDVVMMGGHPEFLSLGLIIEEGFAIEELRRILTSFGATCTTAGVTVVTGDTKVVERGVVDGVFINTTGFGRRVFGPVGPSHIRPGDAVLISGTIGDHGAAIMNAREQLGFTHTLLSDCAPLADMLEAAAKAAGERLHALRDPTRGGLAATLNEFVTDTGYRILLDEAAIPIRSVVASFLDILGLDVLTLANEGKALLFVAPDAAEEVLEVLRTFPQGVDAARIGTVEDAGDKRARVLMTTTIGTRRIIDMPVEAGLPRIC